MPTLARAIAPCVLLASIAMGASARAEDPEFVAWTAPAGCPDAAHVRADVARLGGVLAGADRATVIAVSRAGRWHATIAMSGRDGAGERTVEAATCKSVAEAAALVIALAFPAVEAQPEAPRVDAPPARLVEPLAPPVVPIAPSALALPREAPSRARAPFAAGVAFVGIAGALPSAAPGVAMSVAWLPGRLRLEAGATVSATETATVIGAPIGAEFRLLSGALRTCVDVFESRFSLAPCAGIETARIHASGFGTTASRDTDETRAAGLFGVVAAWAIDRTFALRLGIDGVVPFARPRFVVDADAVAIGIHRPSAVWARALFGAEVRF